ncbi:MAG TPA: SRPBCC family protein [Thermoanaerobaculia bacterium]
MLLTIAIALVLLVLLRAATKPDTFRVQRATTIAAPPEEILPLINDFHYWGVWSPYERLDPVMRRSFSEPARGRGAVYAWESEGRAGVGRMEIKDASPAKVTIQLDFVKPFAIHNVAEFTLQPANGATAVTWSMQGRSPFIVKLMSVVFPMDRIVGRDFETGLAQLKAVVET